MRALTRRIPMLPEPTRRQTILRLALPIIAGMLSQSLINLIDAAMVGSLGEVSLAGVGHLPQLERPTAVADTIRAVTGVR